MSEFIGCNFYIKPTYIVSVPEYIGGRGSRSVKQRESEKHLKDNKHKGRVSAKSSKKIKNAVNWLCESAKEKYLWSKKHKKAFRFKVNLLTLTFPYDGENHVSEKIAKRCLHNFLSYSRKYFYLRNYIWKFERTAAGQLHVHATTDTFISHRRARDSWNRILRGEGLLDSHFQRFGNFNANSTDIHAVYKVKNLGAYIAKYMAKSEAGLSDYKGRIWGCNREISEVNSCSVFVDRATDDAGVKYLMSGEVDYKPIYSAPDKMGSIKQIAEMFFVDQEKWRKLQKSIIREAYDSHRFHIRNNIEEMPPEYWQGFIDEIFDHKLKNQKHETSIPPEQPPNGSIRRMQKEKYGNRSAITQSQIECEFA